jgi:multidrug resistance efflux pump
MAVDPMPNDPPPQRSSRANALVIGLGGCLLLGALGVVMHVLTTRSRDAMVDADFIELASPISGQLMDLKVEAGEAVRAGEPLALVENPRASDGDVRQLRTAFTTAQARLEQLDQQLALQRRLATEFRQDAGDQRRLETARTSNDLDQLRAELARERQELAFSERNLKRQEELFRAGAVAANVVDRARTTLESERQQGLAIEAKIRAQTNRVQAADRNLNLDRTRGGTDPLPRLQEVRLTLAQLEGERVAAQRQVTGLQAQLKTAESLFRKQSTVWIEAPGPAVVWQVQARRGDSLRPQQPLLRLVNCSSRSVTTYVSEQDLRRLRIGSRARIDLIGEELDLRGQVDLIRSGVGRLSSQNEDSAPLPINLARESRVRVRIDNDVPAPPRKLCFVGYSARVIFQ